MLSLKHTGRMCLQRNIHLLPSLGQRGWLASDRLSVVNIGIQIVINGKPLNVY